MEEKIDIYDSKGLFEYEINRLKHDDNISEENKKTILEFRKYLELQGLSIHRELIYFKNIRLLARYFKTPFKTINKEDIQNSLIQYKKGKTKCHKKVIDHKLSSLKVMTLKKFFQWLFPEDYKKLLNGIKPDKSDFQILPSELLTFPEIKKMVESENNIMYRALISLVWEAAARISEATNIKIKDISFGKDHIEIILNGKTGKRRIPVVWCTPYIEDWLKVHPYKSDENSYLFVKTATNSDKDMANYPPSHRAIMKKVSETAKKAEIQGKRVNLHGMRHSRLTFLAVAGLDETSLKTFSGWSKDSNMASVYIHFSKQDIIRNIMNLYTGEKVEEKKPVIELICPNCQKTNPANNRHCSECGRILDTKLALKNPIKIRDFENEIKDAQQKALETRLALIEILESFGSKKIEKKRINEMIELLKK